MPAMPLISVDLPAPLSPTRAVTCPDRQVHPAQDLNGRKVFFDVLQFKQWCVGHGVSPGIAK
jgi:hypothetical protein